MSKKNTPDKGKKSAPKKASEPKKPASPSKAKPQAAAKASSDEGDAEAKGGVLSRLAGRFLGKLKGQAPAQPAKTAAGEGAPDAPAKAEKAPKAEPAETKPADAIPVAEPAAKPEPKAAKKAAPKAAEAKKPAVEGEASTKPAKVEAAKSAPKAPETAKVETAEAEASTLPSRAASAAKAKAPASKAEAKPEAKPAAKAEPAKSAPAAKKAEAAPKAEPKKEAKPSAMPKPESTTSAAAPVAAKAPAPASSAPAPQAVPAPAPPFASASAQSVSDFAHAAMKAEQAPSSASVYVVPAAKKSAGFTSEAILARFELEPAHPHQEPNYGPPEDWGMEIDEEYGDTRVVLLPRDPEWAFAYWEISPADRLHYALPRGGHAGDNALALRVKRLGGNGEAVSDYVLEVGGASTWYLQLEPNASFMIEIGYRDALGRFFALASSGKVTMPRNQPSDQSSAESDWMIVEEDFEKIFQASGGEVVAVERRVGSGFVTDLARLPETTAIKTRPFLTFPVGASEQLLSSGSGGVAGVKLPPAKKDFWLRVRTELILYGETEPDAKVTVSGEAVNLRPDGSFTLRYAFPEGVIELPVVAVNADGDIAKWVTPVAERTTKDVNL